MAKLLDKSNITTGQPVEAWNVSQSIDAFTAIDDYSIKISGSLDVTGSVEITGTISGSSVQFGDGTTQSTAATSGETYDLNATQDGSNVDLNLTSTSGTDDSVVQLTAGTNVTLTRNSATEVTIDAAGGGETYDLNATQDGSNVDLNLTSTSGADDSKVKLLAGSNITLTRNSADEVTIQGNAGTVTSVTGTAPVVSSGGATPAISMGQSTTSTDGYLTSADWNTFREKIAGSIASGQVAYGDTAANTIEGVANFTYDDATDILTVGTYEGKYNGQVGIDPATPDSSIKTPLKLLVGTAQLQTGLIQVQSFQSIISANTLGVDLFVTICQLGTTTSPSISCIGLSGGILEFGNGLGGNETFMFQIWYVEDV
jgi:hypothetical protein